MMIAKMYIGMPTTINKLIIIHYGNNYSHLYIYIFYNMQYHIITIKFVNGFSMLLWTGAKIIILLNT